MKVHNELGPGFQEVIYQRALAVELRLAGISFEREHSMDIIYKREWPLGQRRVDFLVESRAMIELKAIRELDASDKVQISNYCRIYGLAYGLLINFGGSKLQYHRIYNLKHPTNIAYRKQLKKSG